MTDFGLVGKNLIHSFSKFYFTEKFKTEHVNDARYLNFEIDQIDKISEIVTRYPNLAGFNVTLPYKQQIIPYLHKVEPEAKQIGAVNTVKVIRSKNKTFFHGFNTDAQGFRLCIEKHLQPYHNKALIFGTGGSAQAIAHSLRILNIEFKFVSRNKCNHTTVTYDQLSPALIASNKLLINCTPVGMFPDTEGYLPVHYKAVGPEHLVFDLIYNPEITQFLKKSAACGAKTINGLEMLHQQAELAWKIWNNL